MLIREETQDDWAAVRSITFAAFSNSEFGYNGESELIESIRSACERYLSLVAIDDGAIVGHILFSPVVIKDARKEVHGMGLAPMSVATHCQGKGIGSTLVTVGISRLSGERCPFVVVLGHPDYYPRFGFQRAAELGVSHGFDGIPQEAFFIKATSDSEVLEFSGNANAYFRTEFGPQHEPSSSQVRESPPEVI